MLILGVRHLYHSPSDEPTKGPRRLPRRPLLRIICSFVHFQATQNMTFSKFAMDYNRSIPEFDWKVIFGVACFTALYLRGLAFDSQKT